MPYRKEKSPERSFAQDSERITQDLQLLRHGFDGAQVHRAAGSQVQCFIVTFAIARQVAGLVPDDDLSITSWNVLDLELAGRVLHVRHRARGDVFDLGREEHLITGLTVQVCDDPV